MLTNILVGALATTRPHAHTKHLDSLIAEVRALANDVGGVSAEEAPNTTSPNTTSGDTLVHVTDLTGLRNQTFGLSLLEQHLHQLRAERAERDGGVDEGDEDEDEGCVDAFGWRDRDFDPCSEYEPYCTADGGYTDQWEKSWGKFADYGMADVSATSACCACGGGRSLVAAMAAAADSDGDARISLDEMADVEHSWQAALRAEEEARHLDVSNRTSQLQRGKALVHEAKARIRTLKTASEPRRATRRHDRRRAAALDGEDAGEATGSEPGNAEREQVEKWGGEDAVVEQAEELISGMTDLLHSTQRARTALERTRAWMRDADEAVETGDRMCRTAELADADGDGVLATREFLDACYLEPTEE